MASVGPLFVQVATPVFEVLFGVQVVVVYALVLSPAAATQLGSPAGPVFEIGQVVAM